MSKTSDTPQRISDGSSVGKPTNEDVINILARKIPSKEFCEISTTRMRNIKIPYDYVKILDLIRHQVKGNDDALRWESDKDVLQRLLIDVFNRALAQKTVSPPANGS